MMQPIQIGPPGDLLSLERLEYYGAEFGVPLLKNLLLAALIFVLGRMIARMARRGVSKLLKRANIDDSLARFVTDVTYAFLLAIVVIAALERLGVKTTAAIAILGAAGLAIGLALQGSLGNFAAGIMILLFKPYKVGDLVTIGDHTGTVKEIKIFVTIIHSPENRQVILPNGQTISGAIVNYSATGKLRVDLTVGIGYGEDIKRAKEIMYAAVKSVPGIMTDPEPTVALSELGESSVNFAVRPWTTVDNYWAVYFATLEACKIALDEAGIEIPFPQRDLHIKELDPAAAKALAG
jgi:small conductance mechanosensitive channel